MEVYKGPHLTIKHEEEYSRLISTWKSSPANEIGYRKEMLEYLDIVEKIKPTQIMWILDKLTFYPCNGIKKWVEENILKPIFRDGFVNRIQHGLNKLAFVVGNDVLAYIEVMDIFKENSFTSFNPNYFSTEIEARNWLSKKLITKVYNEEDQNLEISYKGKDNNGKVVFEIKESASNFDCTINLFKTIIEKNDFKNNNIDKYSSLTQREKETLKFIVKGYTNLQISNEMFVSHHTIRTHRNRIWKKLEIKHFRDCVNFEIFLN
jgi:DNA-binding CsgD family transcriptional regulator